MTTRKNIVTAAIVIAMLGLAVSAQAAVVTYEMRVGGLATGSGPGGAFQVGDAGIAAGVPFQLEIWAKVTDNQYDIGGTLYDLGILQYNVDIDGGHGAALEPTEGNSGPPLFLPTGNWVASSDADFAIFFPGRVTEPSPLDVYQQAAQIPTDNWLSNLMTHSANTWTKLGEGEYTWDGSGPLTLTATSLLAGNIVAEYPATSPYPGVPPTYGHTLGDGDSVNGDTITFAVPESFTPLLTTTPASGAILDFALVRVGTTGDETVTATNTGDAGSTLSGTFPSASGEFGPGSTSAFGPLGSGVGDDRPYAYTPTAPGLDTQDITVTSNGGDSTITLSGTGVGPVFDSSIAPDSTLDFGEVVLGTPESLFLDISNITTDPNGGDVTLTDLTLLDFSITGADAGLFEIVGFTPSTVVHKADLFSLELDYNGIGTVGMKTAMLSLFTDEGAAFGGDGLDFSYSITAEVVPESLIPFSLDIKPRNKKNTINLKTKAMLPVSILTTDEFDALTVDIETLVFGDPLLIDDGSTPVPPIRFDEVDVNRDGLLDLTLFFSVPELVENGLLGLLSEEASLTGELFDGTEILGSDILRIVPKPKGNVLGAIDEAEALALGGSADISPIPEPSTLALLCMGVVGLLAYGWRKNK